MTEAEMPWLMTWKKPTVRVASPICLTISGRLSELVPERSTRRIPAEDEGRGLRPTRFSCGWMKNWGMVVEPDSERPLTPIFESSNSFTSLARSYSGAPLAFKMSEQRFCQCGHHIIHIFDSVLSPLVKDIYSGVDSQIRIQKECKMFGMLLFSKCSYSCWVMKSVLARCGISKRRMGNIQESQRLPQTWYMGTCRWNTFTLREVQDLKSKYYSICIQPPGGSVNRSAECGARDEVGCYWIN